MGGYQWAPGGRGGVWAGTLSIGRLLPVAASWRPGADRSAIVCLDRPVGVGSAGPLDRLGARTVTVFTVRVTAERGAHPPSPERCLPQWPGRSARPRPGWGRDRRGGRQERPRFMPRRDLSVHLLAAISGTA